MATTNLGVVLFALPYYFRHVIYYDIFVMLGWSNLSFNYDCPSILLDEVL